jgi:hypothetical protein
MVKSNFREGLRKVAHDTHTLLPSLYKFSIKEEWTLELKRADLVGMIRPRQKCLPSPTLKFANFLRPLFKLVSLGATIICPRVISGHFLIAGYTAPVTEQTPFAVSRITPLWPNSRTTITANLFTSSIAAVPKPSAKLAMK